MSRCGMRFLLLQSPTVIRYFCVMYQVALGARLAYLRHRGRARSLAQRVAAALQRRVDPRDGLAHAIGFSTSRPI
jgi:hypothetical protein